MTYIVGLIGIVLACAILGISPADAWHIIVLLWNNSILGAAVIFIIVLFVGGAIFNGGRK